jgi:hypothetical protein
MTANFKLKIRVQDVLSLTCSDANLTLLEEVFAQISFLGEKKLKK